MNQVVPFRTHFKNKKKVNFDLATVSFQVNYDVPDHEYRVPLWKNHSYACKKGNLWLLALRHLTLAQWMQFFVVLIGFIIFLVQTIQALRFYSKGHIQSATTFHIPESIEFPAITLCIPVIIPFNAQCSRNGTNCSRSIRLDTLFNGTTSAFGHQCKFKAGPSAPSVSCATISTPVESFYQNKRCYTYLAQISMFRDSAADSSPIEDYEHTRLILTIQSNQWATTSASLPQLYVHHSDQIPVDLLSPPIALSANLHYTFRFTRIKFVKLDSDHFQCHNYSEPLRSTEDIKHLVSRQDCLDRCVVGEMEQSCGECVTDQLPIRKDLIVKPGTKRLCPGAECDHIDSMLANCATRCPSHCSTVYVETEVTEASLDDPSETRVTLIRKVAVDKQIEQLPLMTGRDVISHIGGLFAFWLMCVWFTVHLIRFSECLYDQIALWNL